MVEALLAHGAKIDAKTGKGVTPILLAAARGDVPTLEVLVARGADVLAATRSGSTLLIAAATAGRAEAIRFLLERKAPVDARDENGRTALMFAAANGQEDVVSVRRKLVQSNFGVAAVSHNGATGATSFDRSNGSGFRPRLADLPQPGDRQRDHSRSGSPINWWDPPRLSGTISTVNKHPRNLHG